MSARRLILGTRGSALAVTQSSWVADRLRERSGDLEIELRTIRTEGDRLQARPPAPGEQPDKGIFCGALRTALRRGEIDFAVHSLKDLPVEEEPDLTIAAVPEREDAREALLSLGANLRELPPGSRVATGSPRRARQLLRLRPDLSIVPVRGNVDTRIRKLREGRFEALVLALSGLRRLGRDEEVVEILALSDVLPAPGQGALAVEAKRGDLALELREMLDDPVARACVEAERAVLQAIGGGCNLPLGAYASALGSTMELKAVLFSEDGMRHAAAVGSGPRDDPARLGGEVAALLVGELGVDA